MYLFLNVGKRNYNICDYVKKNMVIINISSKQYFATQVAMILLQDAVLTLNGLLHIINLAFFLSNVYHKLCIHTFLSH